MACGTSGSYYEEVRTMIERPRRNRVTPFGTIEATHHRGQLLGNRGDLHAADGSLGELTWKHRAWISCTLRHGSKRVGFDRPGTYYPLFFPDEAVAIAAGHRPCGKCRPRAHYLFKRAWNIASGYQPDRKTYSREIDLSLHPDRIEPRTAIEAEVEALPNGTFVSLPNQPDLALLVWNDILYRWHWDGYQEYCFRYETKKAALLTPQKFVEVLAAGYDGVLLI